MKIHIFEEKMANFIFKFDENYEPTNLRISANLKYKKNQTTLRHIIINYSESMVRRKTLKARGKKKNHIIYKG